MKITQGKIKAWVKTAVVAFVALATLKIASAKVPALATIRSYIL